jgi:hypothetical protein
MRRGGGAIGAGVVRMQKHQSLSRGERVTDGGARVREHRRAVGDVFFPTRRELRDSHSPNRQTLTATPDRRRTPAPFTFLLQKMTKLVN